MTKFSRSRHAPAGVPDSAESGGLPNPPRAFRELLKLFDAVRKCVIGIRARGVGELSEALAGVFVWALIATFAIFFSALALTKLWAFQTHGFDLGNYDQTVWNTLHGRLLVCTNWPSFGESRLAFHVEPILLLIAPLYLLHDGPETLLVLQAVVVGLGAWPVVQIARLRLDAPWAGPLFAAVYLLFPALEAGPVFEFHAVTLASTFLAMALYAIEVKRYRSFVVWGILTALCKEEMPLLVAMMGLYLVLKERRYKLGVLTALLSAVWFLVNMQVVLPYFNVGGRSAHLGRYSYLGDGLLDIAANVVRQPAVLLDALRDPLRQAYFWRIPLPVGYLALLSPETLLLTLPTVVVNVLSMYSPMYALDFLQYSVPLVPFVVVAAIYGSERLLALASRLLKHVDRRFLLLILGGYLLFASLFYHDVYGYTPLASGFRWPQVTEHHRIGHALLEEIPPDAAISAQMPLNPHLSNRRWVFVFPEFERADYVVLDVSSPRDIAFELIPGMIGVEGGGNYSGDPSLTHTAYQRLVNGLLRDERFGVVQARDSFLVLKREAPHIEVPEAFYSVFLADEQVPSTPVRADFGGSRELVGLTFEPGPGSAHYLHTYWRGAPAEGKPLHTYLVLVDRSVAPGQVVAVQELTASAFVPERLWESGRQVYDRVFVFFPPNPELYSLGLMVGTEWVQGAMAERLPIAVEVEADTVRVEDRLRVLLLNPGGWEETAEVR
jgi:uncharacterized membrane protein